jgi:hypothetical protein
MNKMKYQVMLALPTVIMMFGYTGNNPFIIMFGLLIIACNVGVILSDIIDAIKEKK